MYEWALVAALGLGAPAPKEVSMKADELVGEWLIQSITQGGRTASPPEPPSDRHVIRFAADGTIAWPNKDGKDRGAKGQTYKLDVSTSPARIDLTTANPDGPKSTALGILKIEEGQLTLAIAAEGAERPSTFDSSKLNSTTIFVLKPLPKSKD